MSASFKLTYAAFALLLLSGCIERSVVVKVKPDQSAVIQVRSYTEKPTLFVSSDTDEEPTRKIPSPEVADQIAQQLGPGVTVTQLREATNSSGWSGFEAVFDCNDISKVTLNVNLLSSMNNDQEKNESKNPVDAFSLYAFSFKNNEMIVTNKRIEQGSVANERETRDPFASAEPMPTVNPIGNAIMDSVVKRLRIGTFIQVDGQIESTNARHNDNGMIALLSIDGVKLKTPEIQKMFRVKSKDPDFANKMHQLDDDVEGIKADLQTNIRVKFK